ncbi:sensor histidine kinase [Sediminibacterium goheungense]|uniref:Histidine kinase n=1 Tax=Sediminibacterium goheungense TaxID=1086393 RepID=A0A4R6IVV1_9BACT|nr:sensor histidine kinase [Sediminibacterium goheungense]TDO26441.1 histidine kinase [Sediminibacterium goheungense]
MYSKRQYPDIDETDPFVDGKGLFVDNCRISFNAYTKTYFYSKYFLMRKNGFYILLWTVYYLVVVFVEAEWLKQGFPDMPLLDVYKKTASASAIFISVQILFFYYLIFFWLDKVVDATRLKTWKIAELIFMYTLTVFVKRALSVFITQPLIYELGPPVINNLFDIRLLFTSMLFLSFPIGISIAIEFLSFRIYNLQKEKELVRDKLTTELSLLRNKLHPHFLFNTLNNIYSLSRKKSESTSDAILKLAELLSFMLYESGSGRINIKREIAFINDYITLERLRYGTRLELRFETDIDNENELISPLLLLPLIENAFKHGSAQSPGNSTIFIQLKLVNGNLSFIISNNYNIPSNQKNEGIGLKTLKRQLELLYPGHQLITEKASDKFIANLSINLHQYAEI